MLTKQERKSNVQKNTKSMINACQGAFINLYKRCRGGGTGARARLDYPFSQLMTIEQITKSLSESNIHDLIQARRSATITPLHSPHPFRDVLEGVEVPADFYDVVRVPRILVRSPSTYDLNDYEAEAFDDLFHVDAVPLDITPLKEPSRDGSDKVVHEIKEKLPIWQIFTKK